MILQGGGGGALFLLAHFRTLCSTISHFPSCLFPSIADDIHMISPLSIVSCTYEHFQIEFHVMSLCIQPYKCVAWSPFGLSPNFNTPSHFTTPFEGIRILEVPLGTLTFTSSFVKDALQEDVQHVDLLFKMGDVQVAFGILTCCFAMPIVFFMMHTSIFHLHRAPYFL